MSVFLEPSDVCDLMRQEDKDSLLRELIDLVLDSEHIADPRARVWQVIHAYSDLELDSGERT